VPLAARPPVRVSFATEDSCAEGCAREAQRGLPWPHTLQRNETTDRARKERTRPRSSTTTTINDPTAPS